MNDINDTTTSDSSTQTTPTTWYVSSGQFSTPYFLFYDNANGTSPTTTITLDSDLTYTFAKLNNTSSSHPFSVGDFIAVEDDSTSPAIDSNFLSAGTAGKKITAVVGNFVSTDIDSSSASADYTYASGPQAVMKRATKVAVTGNAIALEEIQVVGG